MWIQVVFGAKKIIRGISRRGKNILAGVVGLVGSSVLAWGVG